MAPGMPSMSHGCGSDVASAVALVALLSVVYDSFA